MRNCRRNAFAAPCDLEFNFYPWFGGMAPWTSFVRACTSRLLPGGLMSEYIVKDRSILLLLFSLAFHCLLLHVCLLFIVICALDMLLMKPTYLLMWIDAWKWNVTNLRIIDAHDIKAHSHRARLRLSRDARSVDARLRRYETHAK